VDLSFYPALYRSSDELSASSQRKFFGALCLHFACLLAAAVLSAVNSPLWPCAVLQVCVLLGALGCSVYLYARRPDRYWYAGRAVAESIKTLTWRFVSRAEPFDGDDPPAQAHFRQTLKAVIEQNQEVAEQLVSHLDGQQISEAMKTMRDASQEDRRRTYLDERVTEQLGWYAGKARSNRQAASALFAALILVNAAAVVFAIARIEFPVARFWPTDALVTLAASLLGWMQAKRYSGLAASYALAAHEISLIREQAGGIVTEAELSAFIGDSENAFSREHTQWVARKDASTW
jgi:hypothetical protein